MSQVNEENWHLAVALIDEQLRVLPIAIASILQPAGGTADVDALLDHPMLKRNSPSQTTGSAGNIVVAESDKASNVVDLPASARRPNTKSEEQTTYLRVVVSNALLAVGMFLREHSMAEIRTPEIQFLGHVTDAILHANTFCIEPGYMPVARFNGLIIDDKMNGKRLFADENGDGLMEFGDAIALLQWMLRYLRGEKNFVSGGDAG